MQTGYPIDFYGIVAGVGAVLGLVNFQMLKYLFSLHS